jgi:hypothetical protein
MHVPIRFYQPAFGCVLSSAPSFSSSSQSAQRPQVRDALFAHQPHSFVDHVRGYSRLWPPFTPACGRFGGWASNAELQAAPPHRIGEPWLIHRRTTAFGAGARALRPVRESLIHSSTVFIHQLCWQVCGRFGRSRVDQIVEWCGGESFESVVSFTPDFDLLYTRWTSFTPDDPVDGGAVVGCGLSLLPSLSPSFTRPLLPSLPPSLSLTLPISLPSTPLPPLSAIRCTVHPWPSLSFPCSQFSAAPSSLPLLFLLPPRPPPSPPTVNHVGFFPTPSTPPPPSLPDRKDPNAGLARTQHSCVDCIRSNPPPPPTFPTPELTHHHPPHKNSLSTRAWLCVCV